MKNPKRVKKLLKFLDYLEDLFKYYLGDSIENKFEYDEKLVSVAQMFEMLRDTLVENSKNSKIHDIKLYQKFKNQENNKDEDS